jgi:hypothetical protein
MLCVFPHFCRMEKTLPADYLKVLYNRMEECLKEGRAIRFRLASLTNKGFQVKVGGLFSFVPFSAMPWNYPASSAWEVVFPYLLDHRFYCQIDRIETDPPRLYINPSVHRLRPHALEVGQRYEGLVVIKAEYGVFLDLGYHFGWASGSIVALLHKSLMKEREMELADVQLGHRLWVSYFGFTAEGRIRLEKPYAPSDIRQKVADYMVGQVVSVQVKKDGASGKNRYIVNGEIECRMPVTKRHYDGGKLAKQAIRHALDALPDGSYLRCEVRGINLKRSGSLLLKWLDYDSSSL